MNESPSERAATDAAIRKHPAFTPGPWHVERRKRTVEIHTESTAGLSGASLAAVHSQRLNNNYPSPAKAEHPQMANAYVMAAAPRMFAALDDALDVWDALSYLIPEEIIATWADAFRMEESISRIKQALADARGEETAQ